MVDNNEAAGTGEGGFISEGIYKLFVPYLNPMRKREVINIG